MQIGNSGHRFGAMAQLFHWGMLALFVALYLSAEVMQEMPKGDDKWALYGLHKSLGVTALLLFFLRIGWRMASPPPPALDSTPAWQHRLAGLVHLLLYLGMLMMPVSGYLMSVAHGHGVEWFGLWSLPDLVGENEALAERAETVHGVVSYALYGLLAIHLAGVFWHQFVQRDNLLSRMLPARQSGG